MIGHGGRYELAMDKIRKVLKCMFGQGGRWKLAGGHFDWQRRWEKSDGRVWCCAIIIAMLMLVRLVCRTLIVQFASCEGHCRC